MYIFNYINNIFKARATKVGHVGPQFACSTGAHLLSHDDSANRPLSKPDDKANTIVFTFLWLMGYYIVMSQRQSLHVSSFVSACRSVMHHFSASRYMALPQSVLALPWMQSQGASVLADMSHPYSVSR